MGRVDIPVFSMDTFDLFRENLDTVFGWIDLLWVGLAVLSAWRALQPEEPEPAQPVTSLRLKARHLLAHNQPHG